MINQEEFISKYTGVGVNVDKVSGFQCEQLINKFLIDVLGIPNPIQALPGPTAIAIFNAFVTNNLFEKIINTPEGVPSQGDFVYFEENEIQQTGSAGDVAIFVSGDTNEMTLFGQNYPTGSLPHLQKRSYAGCVGWLHFIGQIPNIQTTSSIINIEGVNTYGLDGSNTQSNQIVFDTFHKVQQGLYVTIEQFNQAQQTIENLQKDILDLQSKHNEDQKENVNLNSALSALTTSNKEYATEALDAEKVVQDYTGYMDDFAKELALPQNNQTDQELHDEIIKEIIRLQENQKTPQGQETVEEIATGWQTSLKGIVNWLLKNGFDKFLESNNLHVVDASGNLLDSNTVSDRIIAYLDDRFSRLDFLEALQQKGKQQVQKGVSLLQQFLGLFYQRT